MLIVPTGRGMSRTIHSPEHRALCDLLVAAREAAGLTQREVAHRLRRPQSYIAKIEGGERRVDVIEFIALAGAIGAAPTELFARLVTPRGRAIRTRRS